MDRFTTSEIQTGETSIFVRSYGSGPPILLLHGFPQTHLMWRSVAPLLVRNFTVVCADLRGYGRSGCPASARDHEPYAKRSMAQDMITVMERLGFGRFSVAEPIGLWRAWGDDVQGHALGAGHFFPEEVPEQTTDALTSFFGAAVMEPSRRTNRKRE